MGSSRRIEIESTTGVSSPTRPAEIDVTAGPVGFWQGVPKQIPQRIALDVPKAPQQPGNASGGYAAELVPGQLHLAKPEWLCLRPEAPQGLALALHRPSSQGALGAWPAMQLGKSVHACAVWLHSDLAETNRRETLHIFALY